MQPREARAVAVSSWSSLTQLCVEMFGRHYGGGILKLEISAAKRLPVIDGGSVKRADWMNSRTSGADARAYADTHLFGKSFGLSSRDLALLQRNAVALASHRVGSSTEASRSSFSRRSNV